MYLCNTKINKVITNKRKTIMEKLIKDMAIFYAQQLEDEVYHIFNLLEIRGCNNIIPTEIRQAILNRTKKNFNNIKTTLSV